MNILLVTNTYLPIRGGLELSIQSFAEEYRRRGHRVVIVAPRFDDSPPDEIDVIRVAALRNFNGSKYSVKFPVPVFFSKALKGFKPDVVHTQHPFLMGDTALRLAYAHDIPLVFTHHSLYEENIHWMPQASGILKKFIIGLTTGFANLCDAVIAPSESVSTMIAAHGVKTAITVVPTGLHLNQFRENGSLFRKETDLPERAFVVGYVGRLAEEKNLPFLMRAVTRFLKSEKSAYFLVVGTGPLEEAVALHFREADLEGRLRMSGEIQGKNLIDAFQEIDAFAFSSQSETQGMVLNEAMAAGTPVVAVDAPGVRDIVIDKINGRLVGREDEDDFSESLKWVFERSPAQRKKLAEGAKETAKKFSVERSARKSLDVYEELRKKKRRFPLLQRLNAEWCLMTNFVRATAGAFR